MLDVIHRNVHVLIVRKQDLLCIDKAESRLLLSGILFEFTRRNLTIYVKRFIGKKGKAIPVTGRGGP
jgi:hypothetical protein